MITHYTVNSPTTGRKLKLSYKKGVFWKLEKLKGKKLTREELHALAHVIPPTDALMEEYQKLYPTLEYVKEVKEQSLYQQYVSAWYLFYNEFMDMPPRFGAADGTHLKQIIAHLTNVEAGEKEGLVLFKVILDNWKNLDQFHKDNTDLKYINSRINPILNATKKTAKVGTGGADNGVRL